MIIIAIPSILPTYVIERSLNLISDMKRIDREVFKSKKPSLDSIHGPGPAISISTLISNTTGLMPSIPASDATASAQVTAGVSVSVQLRNRIFKY